MFLPVKIRTNQLTLVFLPYNLDRMFRREYNNIMYILYSINLT